MRILTAFSVLLAATATAVSAESVYEARLEIPVPLTNGDFGTFYAGRIFLEVSDDEARYQLWTHSHPMNPSPQDLQLTFENGIERFLLDADYVGVFDIHCADRIRNPFTEFDRVNPLWTIIELPEFPILEPIFENPPVCLAFSTWDVYDGATDDPQFLRLIKDGATIEFPSVLFENPSLTSGTLHTVPEPTAGLTLLAASCVLLCGRRKPRTRSTRSTSNKV